MSNKINPTKNDTNSMITLCLSDSDRFKDTSLLLYHAHMNLQVKNKRHSNQSLAISQKSGGPVHQRHIESQTCSVL